MEYVSTVGVVDAQRAVSVLTDDEFVAAFAAEIPVTLLDSSTVPSSDGIHQRMRCEFATDRFDLPSAVRRFVPTMVRLDWHQFWASLDAQRAESELDVRTHGHPSARVKGRVELSPRDDVLQYSFSGRTHVDVPLAGKKFGALVDEHVIGSILDSQVIVLRRHLGV